MKILPADLPARPCDSRQFGAARVERLFPDDRADCEVGTGVPRLCGRYAAFIVHDPKGNTFACREHVGSAVALAQEVK